MKKRFKRIVCRVIGHRNSTRTHVIQGMGSLTLTRCDRCGNLDHSKTVRCKQFPMPAEVR